MLLLLLILPDDGIQAAATTADTRVAPLRLSATGINSSSSIGIGSSAGSGGAGKAGSGSRRYSMDDFGVQIAHRAELHTSNVSQPASHCMQRCHSVLAVLNAAHKTLFSPLQRGALLLVVGLLEVRARGREGALPSVPWAFHFPFGDLFFVHVPQAPCNGPAIPLVPVHCD